MQADVLVFRQGVTKQNIVRIGIPQIPASMFARFDRITTAFTARCRDIVFTIADRNRVVRSGSAV
jgi:hypothetical protein